MVLNTVAGPSLVGFVAAFRTSGISVMAEDRAGRAMFKSRAEGNREEILAFALEACNANV